jgi:signal transduction histidine kinase/FixJ family two-component response regulator
MGTPLRLLIVDDSEDDSILIARELQCSGYDLTFERVDTPKDFSTALAKQSWDVIIADYSLPRFSGLDVLKLLQESDLDLPIIVVSGTIGEDIAVSTMKAGAHDYVMKDNLTRLGPAIQRELQETEIRLAHRQAEEALELKLDQLAALNQVSQVVTASLDLDQVLSKIVSLTSEVAAADHTSVVLVNEAGEIDQSVENLSGVPAPKYRLRDDGLTTWVVRSRQAVVVDEISDDGTMHPYPGEGAPRHANPFLVEANIKALACLPLMIKERLLGVLYLHSMDAGAFRDQLSVLPTFANQVAIAIENARLFKVEQQQARRLALIADIARIVATTLDTDELLQAVADSIYHHFEYPMIELLTLEEDKEHLLLRGYRGIPIGSPVLITPGIYRHSIELGIIGHVTRSGKPYIASDVSVDPNYYQASQDTPIRSELCVPILEEGKTIGVIDVESDQLAAFGKEDLSLLETVADTVASGLRNIRLYAEAQNRVRELTLLNSISARLGAGLNLNTLINNALQELHNLVKADRTYFITINSADRTWQITHEWVAPGIESDTGSGGSFDDVTGIIETLLASQPFAAHDIATDPRVEAVRERYHTLGIQSVLLVPVRIGKRLFGVLGFDYCREKHAWDPDEVHLLEGVARQLELALDNVHLFEEVWLHAEELAAALAQLEELDRLKNDFIQNVSHELRSPLALIRSYAEMLAKGQLGELEPEQEKPVAVIERRARMLSEMVQDITLILAAEVNPPPPEPVPLDELTLDTAEDFRAAVEQAGLTLHTEIAPQLPLVSGYPTYLGRVLDNLLGNAIKFTPEGGTLTIRLRQDGDQVALEVSDTGIGIPSDQLDRVFERFYQIDGSAQRRYRGMGLGLALVKEIVETYGGQVKVESQLNEGSTFTVLLPIADSAT